MKKHRLIYTILLLFIVITLSGCIDAKFHLTVNKDGSGDFSYQMLMDPTLLAFTADYNDGTDDEQEQNGLYTYDRKPKMDPAIIKEINKQKAAVEK